MGSVVKAYNCQYPCSSLNHNYYYRPCNPISLFAITSPSISGREPSNNGFKQQGQIQFGGHLIIPAVAAWLFLGRLQRYPHPIITTTTAPMDLELEEGAIKELPLQRKPGHVKALHFYKTKPGTVFKLIQLYDSDDDDDHHGNYESLKARIRLSADCLETARRELAERDPGRVLEVVDELMDLLRDMEVYVDQCHKDNVKGYLSSCNRLLARVRNMEARILNALNDDDEPGGGHN